MVLRLALPFKGAKMGLLFLGALALFSGTLGGDAAAKTKKTDGASATTAQKTVKKQAKKPAASKGAARKKTAKTTARRKKSRAAAGLATGAAAGTAAAAYGAPMDVPVPNSSRYADIVIEARTGRILHEVNGSGVRHPASLTKMMTLYLTFQAIEAGRLSLEQRLPISARAAAQSPSKLGLRAGQTIRVQDAILGLVTESANDAAVVLAEAMGGSVEQFAQFMTRQARAIGMAQTVFKNASGLPDPDQVTSARDMARLGYALIAHYPRFYPFFAHETFVYAGRVHDNHNHLMERYRGMDGIKTGYIRASGFNLVASAARDGTRLIGVVFGGTSAPSRDKHMERLLDASFAVAAGRVRQMEGEGDASEAAPDYLTLPGKVAAAFSPPPSAHASADAGDWGIQIGAFATENDARRAMDLSRQRLNPHLAQTMTQIQPVALDGGQTAYRARFMGLPENKARAICAYLIKQSQSCWLVTP